MQFLIVGFGGAWRGEQLQAPPPKFRVAFANSTAHVSQNPAPSSTTMFKRAKGMNYRGFFRRIHEAHAFEWYLEIGCRNGRILDLVQGKTIGVDPVFRLEKPLLGRKPQLHLFQETSDSFFAANRLEALGARPTIAFIDGMHLFEYALRDILNTEAHADPDGVIFVHDCCPFSIEMTTRDLHNLPDIWTGDVWKLIPILSEYRPDLKVSVLDARPTGLLAITGLKPGTVQPEIDLFEIIERYEAIDLDSFGLDNFADHFEFTDAQSVLEEDQLGLSSLAGVGLTAPEQDLVTP